MSRTVRIGIIGSSFGMAQAEAFRTVPEAEIVAVCSARMERAKAMAKSLGISRAYDDYRELVRLLDIDLVSVVAPPHTHHPMSLAALEAGKHVLCEKPFALNVREAKEMLSKAQDTKRLHFVNYEFRVAPARLLLAELLQRNFIGRPFHVVAHANTSMGLRGGSLRPWTWWYSSQYGGGLLGAAVSHWFDALRAWFGEVREVCSTLETFYPTRVDEQGKERPVSSDDAAVGMVRFQNGLLCTFISSSSTCHPPPQRMEVFGANGTLILDGPEVLRGANSCSGELVQLPIPERYAPTIRVDTENRPPSTLPMRLWARKIVDCVLSGEQPAPNFYDGLKSQEIIDAVHRSHQEKRWVSIAEVA
ncbi:MAG: Gfo/Idh/MocA family oxidoreductase [Chloroflexi bacterium]|nr:Gfo/Idh/MocA family oxidoreductase [Chloroflexota bacterium]